MISPEIQAAIRQEIQNQNQRSQFGVQQSSFNLRNGVDSPRIPFTNLADTPTSYQGKIGNIVAVNSQATGLTFITRYFYNGSVASNAAGTPFPTSWIVTHVSTGVYKITHNLNTTNYTVAATSSSSIAIPLIASRSANFFQLDWLPNDGTSSPLDTDFHFELFI